MCRISVITVVLNDALGLKATIESVRGQTYRNIEFVIVDGGSTDQTMSVIHTYSSHIDRWISEPDRGIYEAMNKGAHLGTGQYVLFLNAGDTLFDDSVIERFAAELDLDSDVIFADCYVDGSHRSDGYRPAKDIRQISRGMIGSHQSMLFKRAALCNEMFRLDFGTAGDFELLCRMHANGYRFQKIQTFVASTFVAGGVSDRKRLHSITNCIRALRANGLMRKKDWFFWSIRYIAQAIIQLMRKIKLPA